jgi:hypothetical protein
MLDTSPPPPWFITGTSVLGASHSRLKLPNQDAISWRPKSGKEFPYIMSVSDGHGSPKSVRSQIGSCLAVEDTLTILKEFAENNRSEKKLSKIRERAGKEISVRIESLWKQSVKHHLQRFPFTTKEWETLKNAGTMRAPDDFEESGFLAYGATLLGVLLTETYVLYLQLGDGDILNVMRNGDVVRPVQRDNRFLGNETTSLCSESSADEIRIVVQDTTGLCAELILLSTDGYANSFCDEDEFFKVGPDLLEMVRSEGVDTIKNHLEEWLLETTRMGSGDDITLGILGQQPVSQRKENAPMQSDNTETSMG